MISQFYYIYLFVADIVVQPIRKNRGLFISPIPARRSHKLEHRFCDLHAPFWFYERAEAAGSGMWCRGEMRRQFGSWSQCRGQVDHSRPSGEPLREVEPHPLTRWEEGFLLFTVFCGGYFLRHSLCRFPRLECEAGLWVWGLREPLKETIGTLPNPAIYKHWLFKKVLWPDYAMDRLGLSYTTLMQRLAYIYPEPTRTSRISKLSSTRITITTRDLNFPTLGISPQYTVHLDLDI